MWMEENDEATWTLAIQIRCDVLKLTYFFDRHEELTAKEWEQLCSGKKCSSSIINHNGKGKYRLYVDSVHLSGQEVHIKIQDSKFHLKLKKIVDEAKSKGYTFK